MGQWKSDKVTEGYIANSRPVRLERMNKLVPQDDVPNIGKKEEEEEIEYEDISEQKPAAEKSDKIYMKL